MISSILWITLSAVVAGEPESPCMVLVTGAAGTEEYASQFDQWATRWQETAKEAGLQFKRIGTSKTATDDRQQLQDYLKRLPQKSASPLWIVLIGHGTYAAKQAKFNLHGPDITATELNTWL